MKLPWISSVDSCWSCGWTWFLWLNEINLNLKYVLKATEFELKQARTNDCQTKNGVPKMAKAGFNFSPTDSSYVFSLVDSTLSGIPRSLERDTWQWPGGACRQHVTPSYAFLLAPSHSTNRPWQLRNAQNTGNPFNLHPSSTPFAPHVLFSKLHPWLIETRDECT